MEYLNLPDFRALAALRAVVEHGGVDQAGHKLHIGQPAVTKRLRTLDKCYGLPLMQRDGRRLELTTAGQQVYEFACLILDHQATLLDNISALRAGQKHLRLEVSHAIGEHLLPELLLRFNELHPSFRIDSRVGYSRRIQTQLATGLADLALLEMAPKHPDILVQKWLEDELVLVCGPGHALWGTGPIPTTRLDTLLYVLREASAAMRVTLDKALANIGLQEIPVAMEVGSNDTIMEMLQGGRHVSFLPRFAVQEALAEGSLFHIKIHGLHIMRTLWIARTRANLTNPVAEAFIELLRDGQFTSNRPVA